jgi:hypothetical protein
MAKKRFFSGYVLFLTVILLSPMGCKSRSSHLKSPETVGGNSADPAARLRSVIPDLPSALEICVDFEGDYTAEKQQQIKTDILSAWQEWIKYAGLLPQGFRNVENITKIPNSVTLAASCSKLGASRVRHIVSANLKFPEDNDSQFAAVVNDDIPRNLPYIMLSTSPSSGVSNEGFFKSLSLYAVGRYLGNGLVRGTILESVPDVWKDGSMPTAIDQDYELVTMDRAGSGIVRGCDSENKPVHATINADKIIFKNLSINRQNWSNNFAESNEVFAYGNEPKLFHKSGLISGFDGKFYSITLNSNGDRLRAKIRNETDVFVIKRCQK